MGCGASVRMPPTAAPVHTTVYYGLHVWWGAGNLKKELMKSIRLHTALFEISDSTVGMNFSIDRLLKISNNLECAVILTCSRQSCEFNYGVKKLSSFLYI